MQPDEFTLAWLAGLLEGEGSFSRGLPSNPTKPIISLHMVDEDVVARVAAIWESRIIVTILRVTGAKVGGYHTASRLQVNTLSSLCSFCAL
jgi:hypothetical protein